MYENTNSEVFSTITSNILLCEQDLSALIRRTG